MLGAKLSALGLRLEQIKTVDVPRQCSYCTAGVEPRRLTQSNTLYFTAVSFSTESHSMAASYTSTFLPSSKYTLFSMELATAGGCHSPLLRPSHCTDQALHSGSVAQKAGSKEIE